MNRFVVRERDSGLFVDRWAKLHGELGLAHVFPSAEEAEFYRSTLEGLGSEKVRERLRAADGGPGG